MSSWSLPLALCAGATVPGVILYFQGRRPLRRFRTWWRLRRDGVSKEDVVAALEAIALTGDVCATWKISERYRLNRCACCVHATAGRGLVWSTAISTQNSGWPAFGSTNEVLAKSGFTLAKWTRRASVPVLRFTKAADEKQYVAVGVCRGWWYEQTPPDGWSCAVLV